MISLVNVEETRHLQEVTNDQVGLFNGNEKLHA